MILSVSIFVKQFKMFSLLLFFTGQVYDSNKYSKFRNVPMCYNRVLTSLASGLMHLSFTVTHDFILFVFVPALITVFAQFSYFSFPRFFLPFLTFLFFSSSWFSTSQAKQLVNTSSRSLCVTWWAAALKDPSSPLWSTRC